MNLVRASIEDVPRIMECAEMFCSQIPDCTLNKAHYADCWRDYLTSGSGAIFLLESDGNVAGGIGGVCYPDPLTGSKIAVELFWFVKPEFRRGSWPIKLLKEFEVWARMCYCSHVSMIHMQCSMPAEIAFIYQRLGYELFETIYRKKL